MHNCCRPVPLTVARMKTNQCKDQCLPTKRRTSQRVRAHHSLFRSLRIAQTHSSSPRGLPETSCLKHVKGQCGPWPSDTSHAGGWWGGGHSPEPDGERKDVDSKDSFYPAVVVDKTEPLHGHVSHMTPPEQDFAWRGGKGVKKIF